MAETAAPGITSITPPATSVGDTEPAPPAVEPIPEITHLPISYTPDGIAGPTWVFLFPKNGLGASVVEVYEGQYDVELITQPDLSDWQKSKARRLGAGLGGYVTGSLELQERLSAIEAMPRPRSHVEDIQSAHVALGDALAVVAEVVPGDTPISGWGGYEDRLYIGVGDYLDQVDHRPALNAMARALGIESGWEPFKTAGSGYTYAYAGTWQGHELKLTCREPRRAEPSPAPLPSPLPETGQAS